MAAKRCPNFTHCPSLLPALPALELSLIPLDHSPQRGTTDGEEDACVDDGGNFASSSICSMFHPPQSDCSWNIGGNPKPTSRIVSLARRTAWRISPIFCGISHGRFESRDSFPHYIRCPERGNSFSPFLRRRGEERGGTGGGRDQGSGVEGGTIFVSLPQFCE